MYDCTSIYVKLYFTIKSCPPTYATRVSTHEGEVVFRNDTEVECPGKCIALISHSPMQV